MLEYIQENINNGHLTLQSKVYIRDSWGDDNAVLDIQEEDNALILSDRELT